MELDMQLQIPLDVDVVQRRESRASKTQVEELVEVHLRSLAALSPGVVLNETELADYGANALCEHVSSLTICDVRYSEDLRPDVPITLHVHKLDTFSAERDAVADGGGGEELSACEVWTLPHQEFHGLWESLEYESDLKSDLLRFAETAFELEALGVDPRQVACGRVVLLHGPPGTGKTSLCRALAHKLSVRLAAQFPRARLLEINAHGLFSKWFSESGKLVSKLFDRIEEVVDDPQMLVVILVDEVESLTHARRAALAGLEPSDSIRAVNAVLAALDRLRRRPNAIVLATSNVTAAIDVAFLDRADVKRRVGPPGARAAYAMLRGACTELMARGAVRREPVFSWRVLEAARFAESLGSRGSLRLSEAAQAAARRGVSGRALRRLPFLALAHHSIRKPNLAQFAAALLAALDAAAKEDEELYEGEVRQSEPCTNGH